MPALPTKRIRSAWVRTGRLAVVALAVVGASACQPTPAATFGPGPSSGPAAGTGATTSTTAPGATTSTTTSTPLSASTSARAATSGTGDGASSTTAGASCWGIKRDDPAKASGTYWLLTSAMDRPGQFYCDMTTEGGGWVLVGRGREGWTWDPTGQQTATEVRSAVTGAAAFKVATLDSATINGLIGNAKVSALSDGIRIERSRNSTGTVKQQYKLYGKWSGWTWTLDGGQLLTKSVIDGVTYAGGNTRDSYLTSSWGQTSNALANVQGIRRLFTMEWTGNDNVQGFTYGRSVPGGTSSSTNYLYQKHKAGYPMPFTRVWVRPRIANPPTGYAAIPATGYPAVTKPATLKNRSELAPWGVVGLDHTGEEPLIEPSNTNVLSVKAWTNRVFVGGRFTGVRQGPTGPITTQRYLAAFDLNGTWISTFKPTFNGRVFDMVVTADGKLIVAGDFTQVNGTANTAGLVALNPTTGAVITTWKANVVRAASGTTKMRVRALDLKGTTIYAAGHFTSVTGGTAGALAVTNGISLSAANGTPGTWRPKITGGGVVDLQVTADGSRVLLGGTFTAINGSAAHKSFGITDAATGLPSAGIGTWKPADGTLGTDYQQAVAERPDGSILTGGAQHSTQLWNRNRTAMLDSSITKIGGDTQVIEVFGDKAFVGCHCGDFLFQGTNNYTKPTGFRSTDPINLVGMWNTTTWQYDTSWYPGSLKGAYGQGIWSVDMDQNRCLWVGGDLVRGAYSGNATTDYLGGFARFCQADVTPPTAPTNFQIVSTGTSRKLTWGGSSDASPVVYDIYRNDRVIATVNGFTYTDPNGPAGSKYTVRASDNRGNRSASFWPKAV